MANRRPVRTSWEPIVAVAALLSLALWPIEIHRAFGLPAHPLIIHVPVIFIPILGLAVLAVMFNFRWFERYGCWSRRSRGHLAATLLAVGAGEAFKEDRERFFRDRTTRRCTTTRTPASRCGWRC